MSGAKPVAFGRYLLESKLTSGGMGEIFLARVLGAAGFEKRVVIKRILPHLAESNEFVERFLDEGRLLVRLNHGNIVQVLDMGEVDGTYFLAMEYVDGLDLRALLQRIRREEEVLPVRLAMHILVELAKGLSYAHNRVDDDGVRLNVIHRDVSPSNVMVSRTGEVKLLDFGIAKVAARFNQSISGSLHGKFLYMSPEQAAARPLDHRSDLFSLGSLAYELLTGERPFAGESELKTLDLIRSGVHKPVRDVREDVPAEVEAIVERCLQIDPDKRFQSADSLQRILLAWFVESKTVVSATDIATFINPYIPVSRHSQPVSLDDALQQQIDQLLLFAPGDGVPRSPTQISRKPRPMDDFDAVDPVTGLDLSPTTSSGTTARARMADTADRTVNAASRNRIFLWSIGLLVFVLVALNIIMINTFGSSQDQAANSLQAVNVGMSSSTPSNQAVREPVVEWSKSSSTREGQPIQSAQQDMDAVFGEGVVLRRRAWSESASVRRPRAARVVSIARKEQMRLKIGSLPRNAAVAIDGEKIDTDMFSGDGWPVPGTGMVSFSVQAPGYERWSRQVNRQEGLVTLTPDLKPKAMAVRLRVIPAEASIRMGSRLIGQGSAEITVVGNASKRVRIDAPGYQSEFVTLRYGSRTRTVQLKAKDGGRMTVMVFPAAAKVTLDGAPVSRDSIRIRRKVSPGTHTLRAEYQGQTAIRRFEVKANESKQLQSIRLLR